MSSSVPPFLGLSLALHCVALPWALIRPEHWPGVVAALVLDHCVITAAVLWPRSRLLGSNMRRLPESLGEQRRVALTFDDGPDPVVSPQIADILDRHSATATFFCVGEKAQRHPEVIRDLVARGHAIENHTQSHPPLFGLLGPWRAAKEIDRAQEAIGRAAGSAPVYFRAPAGIRGPWTHRLLESRGLRLVSWSRRGFDTVTRDPERVVDRLTRGLRGGDILLLHDGCGARDETGVPVVVTALPRLLARLAESGLQATAIPRTQAP
jgi:peptidoglycan/xylan/chitin deacetylase (PgdA/CDA1 family)